MSWLVLPASFEYLCYGSKAIINILLFQCDDRLYTAESDVHGQWIVTANVDSRTERMNKIVPYTETQKCSTPLASDDHYHVYAQDIVYSFLLLLPFTCSQNVYLHDMSYKTWKYTDCCVFSFNSSYIRIDDLFPSELLNLKHTFFSD